MGVVCSYSSASIGSDQQLAVLFQLKCCFNVPKGFANMFRRTSVIFGVTIIIYMKKLLVSDWLRAVQFKCNTVQKKCNTSAKSVIPVQITHRNSGL